MDNANSPEYLNKIKNTVIENLSRTKFAPSAQMQDVPRDIEGMDEEAEAELDDLDEDENKDVRNTARRWDKYVERDGELSDSDDEEENQRNGVIRSPQSKKISRRNIMDYSNPNAVPDFESGVNSPTGSPAMQQRQNGDKSNGSHSTDSGDMDVDMDDDRSNGHVSPQQAAPQVEEPPQVPLEEPMDVDPEIQSSEANAAKEAGRAERNEEDLKGEARTEAAAD